MNGLWYKMPTCSLLRHRKDQKLTIEGEYLEHLRFIIIKVGVPGDENEVVWSDLYRIPCQIKDDFKPFKAQAVDN